MPTIMPDGITPAQAMNTYIKELCTPSPYAYNIRLYRLQSQKVKSGSDTRLGLCHNGIEVYEVRSVGRGRPGVCSLYYSAACYHRLIDNRSYVTSTVSYYFVVTFTAM